MNKKGTITDAIAYLVAFLLILVATLLFNLLVAGVLYLTVRFWSVPQAVAVFRGTTKFLLGGEIIFYIALAIHCLTHKDKGDE